MALANYNPEDVFIIVGGVYQLTGVSDGSFISISQDIQPFSKNVTTDGYVNRTHNINNTHTVRITLASTSDDNLILTGWAAADAAIKSAFIPLFIKDANGLTLFYSPLAWVEGVSDIAFDTGVTGREWVFGAAHAVSVVGGNSGGLVDTSLASLGLLGADYAGII